MTNSTKPRLEFGPRLRAFRESRQLSQEQLAQLLGWTSNARISAYERGEYEPSLEDIGRLASALGIFPEVLAFGAETIAAHFEQAMTMPIAQSGEERDIDFIGRIQRDLEKFKRQQTSKRAGRK